MLDKHIQNNNKSKHIAKSPQSRNPHSFGFISVVQIMLELIRSAITHSPITIFRTSRRKSHARSSEA